MNDNLHIEKNDVTATSAVAMYSNVAIQKAPAKDPSEIRLNNCKLLSIIATGGMSTVYLGKQISLNRLVAVKAIQLSDTERENIHRGLSQEAMTMAEMNHPNIVNCYDVQYVDNTLYIIMEFIPARTSVKDLVNRFGPLPEHLAVRILIDVVNGLIYIHQKGYIHRDIKPANLMIYREAGNEEITLANLFQTAESRVKICDFGIASANKNSSEREKMVQNTPEANLGVLGSPNYMAPEQLYSPGKTDFRSDIYALAGTAFFIVTGKPPFNASDNTQLLEYKVQNDIASPIKSGAKISFRLSAIIEKMGRLDQEKRYQDYYALLKDLIKVRDSLPEQIQSDYSARKSLFWKSVSISTIILLFVLSAYFANNYMHDKNIKSSNLSLTNSLGYWDGDRSEWRLERSTSEKKSAMMITAPDTTHPLVLKQVIVPGQYIEFAIRNPGKGTVVFNIKDKDKFNANILWTRPSSDKDIFTFLCNNNSYPIPENPTKYNVWLHVKFQLLKNGLAIYLEDEMVAMASANSVNTSSFSVKVSSPTLVSIKDLFIYQ